MAKKGGEVIKYIWGNKGPLFKGAIAGCLLTIAFESQQTSPPPQREVFACAVLDNGTRAFCPDGSISLSRHRIKVVSGGRTESAGRDPNTGNGAVATATDIFTALGSGSQTQVIETVKP